MEKSLNVEPLYDKKINPLEDNDSIPLTEQNAELRFAQWQNELLDFTPDNPLLNFRFGTSGIPLITPDLPKFQDILLTGKEFILTPRPAEPENVGQDFNCFIAQELENGCIRSALDKADLIGRVSRLYRDFIDTLADRGEHSLFIALGFLKWSEGTAARYAPIALLPAEIIKSPSQDSCRIFIRNGELQINSCLLEFLQSRFGADISPLSDFLYTGDSKKLFALMKHVAKGVENSEISESAAIGLFPFAKFLLWKDLFHNVDKIKGHSIVKGLLTGKIPAGQTDASKEGLHSMRQEIFCPFNMDFFQRDAITAAAAEKSFLLNGPPGTGKSQTIANILCNAISAGKTVLFVSKKAAALKTAAKRLQQKELRKFCLELYSPYNSQNNIAAQFTSSFTPAENPSLPEIAEKKQALVQLENEISDYIHALHDKRSIGESLYTSISAYYSLDEAAPVPFPGDVSTITEKAFLQLKHNLRRHSAFEARWGNPSSCAFAGIQCEEYSSDLHRLVCEKSQILADSSSAVSNELQSLLEVLDLTDLPVSRSLLQNISALCTAFCPLPEQGLPMAEKALQPENFSAACIATRKALSLHDECTDLKDKIFKVYSPEVLDADLQGILFQIREASGKWFLSKKIESNKVFKTMLGYVKSGVSPDRDNLVQDIETMLAIKKLEQELRLCRIQDIYPTLFHEATAGWGQISAALLDAEKWEQAVLDFSHSIKANEKSLRGKLLCYSTYMPQLQKFRHTAFTYLETLHTLEEALLLPPFDGDRLFEYVLSKCTSFLAQAESLKDYCALLKAEHELCSAGYAPVLQNKTDFHLLFPAVMRGFYQKYITAQIHCSPTLADFSGKSMNERFLLLRSLRKEIAEISAQEIAMHREAQIQALPDNTKNTIQEAVQNTPLHKLFSQLSDLLPILKPCILATPSTTAQYLDFSLPLFDYVIFDEASQIPSCEAAAIIARGKTVILAGDPQQLPPDTQASSVFDDFLSINFPQKQLFLHYRSHYQELIEFSNTQYYGGQLTAPPAPKNHESSFITQKIGNNNEEADAVVNELFARLKSKKDTTESIGVVTFSYFLQEQIQNRIALRLKKEPNLEKYFLPQCDEPVFVKNADTVQGYERDIILLATQYDPSSGSFGCIDSRNGQKMLNTAISRARSAMILFTAIDPEQVDLFSIKSKGAKDLTAFISYAKSCKKAAAFPNNCTFAEYIAQRLRNLGYTADTGIGTGKYHADIGVSDASPGRYLLAIQCTENGPLPETIENCCNAYEPMLEHSGWRTMHIWPVEYWTQEEQVLNDIVSAIEQARNDVEEERKNRKTDSANNIYTVTHLTPVAYSPELFFTETCTEQIAEQIKSVLIQESPITLALLTKRIAAAWGMKKSAKAVSRISDILNRHGFFTSTDEKKIIVWLDEQQESSFHIYRIPLYESERRLPDDICIQEYRCAVLHVLTESPYSLPRCDLIRETARALGFKRSGAKLDDRINHAIALLIENNVISKNENGHFSLI